MAGPRGPSWLIRGEAIEKSIRDCRLRQPTLVGRMFWTAVACQLLLVAEVAVVMWSLRLPIYPLTVLAVDGSGHENCREEALSPIAYKTTPSIGGSANYVSLNNPEEVWDDGPN